MATHQDQSREDEVEKIDSHIIIDLCTPPPDHESTPILMAIPEEDVLKPKDASLRNSDEWPTFNLQKISVTSQKTGEVCSLLAAHKANPVIVLGKLEKVDSDLLPLIRDKRYREKSIELRNVTTYAFAEYEDGSYGFWAAGKAGWFEIQSPAASFEQTYSLMNEAASMFYMLADKLRRAIKKRPKLNAKELDKYTRVLYKEYLALGKSLRLSDVDDVREAFHEHRGFLITSMLECQEGLDWAQTPMLNYYESKFPDEYCKIEARVFGTSNATKGVWSENRDSSRKRKSQSPHPEGPKDKKMRKGKAAVQMEPQLPETPPSKQNLDAVSSDEEEDGVPNVLTRKRKSILQPSGGKTARKAAGRRKSLLAVDRSNEGSYGEKENDEDSQLCEGSPITTIRTAEELELSTNPPRERSPGDNGGPKYLPRKYLELRVVEYDLPSTKPQGPGDLWTCIFEGCLYRVHEASKAEGKARIMEHFETHATHAQQKINLALNESRPYLPVK
ncbi:MAG: hypothetical protein ALECFALPRED_000294 [Alectoria fallacina]|uniref:RFTS domain-containing protein n=1 Tax=Alectoria fallacina TaxID=1903189 RepID=A0A8H3J9K4_9LECA|nr:MAG: hypothetical protein ALECFALPRED_000294 [Alectoria fallacina]